MPANAGSGHEGERAPSSEHEPSKAKAAAAAGQVEPHQGDAGDDGSAAENLILAPRERADETLETSGADTGNAEICRSICDKEEGEREEEQHGVVSALRTIFGTPQNACIFAALALSGISKGVIDTFLFIW